MNNIVYIYDIDTKEYLYSMECQYDPIDDDNLLAPPNSIQIKPPVVKDSEVAVVNNDITDWIIGKDYRGQFIYNTKTKEISTVNYIGDIKNGWTLSKPLPFSEWDGTKWVVDVYLLKQSKLKLLRDYRDNYLSIGVQYKNINFYSTKDDAKDLISLGINIIDDGKKVNVWKGINGFLENPTKEELLELYDLCSKNINKAYVSDFKVTNDINKLTTAEDIENYNVQDKFNEYLPNE